MLALIMALAIISMSFVFPALGMSDGSANQEIPQFNISTTTVDFVGDAPARPGSPASAEVSILPERNAQNNVDRLSGNGSDGRTIEVLPPGTVYGGDMAISVITFENGVILNQTNYRVTPDDRDFFYAQDEWEIEIEALENDTAAGRYIARYKVVAEPTSGGSILTNVPVLGSAIEAGASVGAVLGWLVETILWAFGFLIETIINTGATIAKITVYVVDLLAWMSEAYFAIVGAASGWVSAFVALPGVIFSLLFVKLIISGISILPTT
jgi:hypothetical protein